MSRQFLKRRETKGQLIFEKSFNIPNDHRKLSWETISPYQENKWQSMLGRMYGKRTPFLLLGVIEIITEVSPLPENRSTIWPSSKSPGYIPKGLKVSIPSTCTFIFTAAEHTGRKQTEFGCPHRWMGKVICCIHAMEFCASIKKNATIMVHARKQTQLGTLRETSKIKTNAVCFLKYGA